jgi:hypothetical protein
MKFDKLVKSLLNEAPTAAFATKDGQVKNIDLHITDKYMNDWEGLKEHIRNTMSQLQDPDTQNKFIEELKANKGFNYYLDSIYKKRFEEFLSELNAV